MTAAPRETLPSTLRLIDRSLDHHDVNTRGKPLEFMQLKGSLEAAL